MAIPVTLNQLGEHMLLRGGPGSGKTSIGLFTITRQLITRPEIPLLIVDCGDDPAWFHFVRTEAERHGRTFKFATNAANRATYAFNPLLQDSLKGLFIGDLCGLIGEMMNLWHGSEYARDFYSRASRGDLRQGLRFHTTRKLPLRSERARREEARLRRELPFGIQSLDDVAAVVRVLSQAKSQRDSRDAKHLLLVLEELAEVELLNLSWNRPGTPRAVMEHAIHFPDVIRNGEVVYFALTGMRSPSSSGDLTRIVIQSALQGCLAHEELTGDVPRMFALIDEADVIMSASIARVLARSRKHGLGLVLSHQSRDQLRLPGGLDLRSIVDDMTAVKWVFDVRNENDMRAISATSGQVAYAERSWDQRPSDERYDPARAVARREDEDPTVRIAERVGPRITLQDINEINRDPTRSMLRIERGDGPSQFEGWFPIRCPYPITRARYEELKAMRWPAGDERTITFRGEWTVERMPPDEWFARRDGRPAFDPAAVLDEIRRRVK